jgi:hypothetical protein
MPVAMIIAVRQAVEGPVQDPVLGGQSSMVLPAKNHLEYWNNGTME